MSEENVLSVERSGHVATVWLEREQARNAMAPSFFEQLPQVMESVASDSAVRAVVIAARGRDFSVGLDLKAMAGLLSGSSAERSGEDVQTQDSAGGSPRRPSNASSAGAIRSSVLGLQRSISSVAMCPKPVVAAIHGYCIGGGVDLASACDIRIASSEAIFSVRETRVAIVADLGSLQRLPRIIGKGHLAELAYTGKDIDAERALRIGLVNEVHRDPPTTQASALALAEEIADNSPLAVQGTKAVIEACEDRSVEEGLDYVATWNAGFLQSDDLMEAMSAFVAKRRPKFEGR